MYFFLVHPGSASSCFAQVELFCWNIFFLWLPGMGLLKRMGLRSLTFNPGLLVGTSWGQQHVLWVGELPAALLTPGPLASLNGPGLGSATGTRSYDLALREDRGRYPKLQNKIIIWKRHAPETSSQFPRLCCYFKLDSSLKMWYSRSNHHPCRFCVGAPGSSQWCLNRWKNRGRSRWAHFLIWVHIGLKEKYKDNKTRSKMTLVSMESAHFPL